MGNACFDFVCLCAFVVPVGVAVLGPLFVGLFVYQDELNAYLRLKAESEDAMRSQQFTAERLEGGLAVAEQCACKANEALDALWVAYNGAARWNADVGAAFQVADRELTAKTWMLAGIVVAMYAAVFGLHTCLSRWARQEPRASNEEPLLKEQFENGLSA